MSLWEKIKRFFGWRPAGEVSSAPSNTNGKPITPAPSPPKSPTTPTKPLPGLKPPSRPSDLPSSNHYVSRDRKILGKEYRYLWAMLDQPDTDILPYWRPEAKRQAETALRNRVRYQKVAGQFGSMPWWAIAAINLMEHSQKFTGTLLNGDDFTKKTIHHPKGLGPWGSWEEAGVFAMRHAELGFHWDLGSWKWGDVGETFYFFESYNGHNARLPEGSRILPPNASPYVYSGTPFYSRGKRVERKGADGVIRGSFDETLVSAQLGVMAFLKQIDRTSERLFP